MSVITYSMILLVLAGILVSNGEKIENSAQNKTALKEKREYSPNNGNSNRFHYEKSAKAISVYAGDSQDQNVNLSYNANALNDFAQNGQYDHSSGGYSSGGSLQPVYVMGDLSSLLKNTQNLGSLFTGQQASQLHGTTTLQNVGPVIFGSASSASSNGAAHVQANPSYGSNSQAYLQIPQNNYASNLQVPFTNYGIPSTQIPLNSYSLAKPSFSDFASSYKFPTSNFGSSLSNYNFFPTKPYNFDTYSSGNQQYNTESLMNALKQSNIGQNNLVDSKSILHSSSSNDNSNNYFGGHLLQNPLSKSSYNSLLSSYPHSQILSLPRAPSFSAASIASYKPERLSLPHNAVSSGVVPAHIMLAPSSGYGSINIMDFARSLGTNIAAYSSQSEVHPSSGKYGNSGVPFSYSNKFANQYLQDPSINEQPQHYEGNKYSELTGSHEGSSFPGRYTKVEGNKYAEHYTQAPSSAEQSKHYARQSPEESAKVYNTIKYSEPMEAPDYMPK